MTEPVGSQSILARASLPSSIPLSTPLQSQVDGLVGGFAAQATDWRSLASMMAGGTAYRLGRVGILGLGSGNALRVASVGVGLGAEVLTFEGSHRALTALSGEDHHNPNLFRWNGHGGIAQGLLHSFVTFGTLKGFGRLGQGQNVVAQHLLQDTGMVLGHQFTGAIGIAPRPTGTLAEQFLPAEAPHLQLGAGMALAHGMAPGVQGLERGLDLSLPAPSAAPSISRFFGGENSEGLGLRPALATAGAPAATESPRAEAKGPTILMMNESGEGRGPNETPAMSTSDLKANGASSGPRPAFS